MAQSHHVLVPRYCCWSLAPSSSVGTGLPSTVPIHSTRCSSGRDRGVTASSRRQPRNILSCRTAASARKVITAYRLCLGTVRIHSTRCSSRRDRGATACGQEPVEGTSYLVPPPLPREKCWERKNSAGCCRPLC